MLNIEHKYNTRMAKLEKLKKIIASRYVDIYAKKDDLLYLFSEHNNNEIDHDYINSFLADIKEEIVRKIKSM